MIEMQAPVSSDRLTFERILNAPLGDKYSFETCVTESKPLV